MGNIIMQTAFPPYHSASRNHNSISYEKSLFGMYRSKQVILFMFVHPAQMAEPSFDNILLWNFRVPHFQYKKTKHCFSSLLFLAPLSPLLQHVFVLDVLFDI